VTNSDLSRTRRGIQGFERLWRLRRTLNPRRARGLKRIAGKGVPKTPALGLPDEEPRLRPRPTRQIVHPFSTARFHHSETRVALTLTVTSHGVSEFWVPRWVPHRGIQSVLRGSIRRTHVMPPSFDTAHDSAAASDTH
jgi:hypothetical protein